MRSTISKQSEDSGTRGNCSPPRSGCGVAQQQINLTAGPTTVNHARWLIGAHVGLQLRRSRGWLHRDLRQVESGSAAGWSPVVITVPTGQGLQINLTNNLSFCEREQRAHVADDRGSVGRRSGDERRTTTPRSGPHQRPGQRHVAYRRAPATGPVRRQRRDLACSRSRTEVRGGSDDRPDLDARLGPGTYLLESGTHPSIQGPMGLYGMVVVTSGGAPTGAAYPVHAYPGVTYNADVPLLFSEIDPVQNKALMTAVNTAGFSETAVWSGQPGGCGNPTSATYIPAIHRR